MANPTLNVWRGLKAPLDVWRGQVLQVPVVLGVSPLSGINTGGQIVTITGYGLTGATVMFGSVAGAITFQSDTKILVVAPAGSGTVTLSISNAVYPAVTFQFSYGADPVVLSISPIIGQYSGGTPVTIQVTSSAGCISATVCGTALTSFAIVDATHVSGITGAMPNLATPGNVTVSNSFDPSAPLVGVYFAVDLTGLVAWYKDAGQTASSNVLSAWADQSGAGNNQAATGTNQPTLVPAGLNNLPYVQSNGSTNVLQDTTFALGAGSNISVYMLSRNNASGTMVSWDYNGLAPALVPNFSGAGFETLFASGGAPGPASSVSTSGAWHRTLSVVRAAGTQDLWTNGADHQTATEGGTVASSGTFSLAGKSDKTLLAQVDIAEVLVFKNDQTANVAFIDNYLKYKWYAQTPVQTIDMSAPASSYTGVTYARTGANAVVATSASTAAQIAAGIPLYENRGDGLEFGVWTFPAFTNDAAQNVTTWATVNSGVITALAAGTAPDGSAVAYEVNDTNAAAIAGASFAVSSSDSRVQSTWVRDHAGTVPSSPGMLASNLATPGGNAGGVSLGSGTVWRRVSYADNQTSGFTSIQVLPAGAQPATSNVAATGAVDVAFPSSVAQAVNVPPLGGTADYPTILGSTGAATMQLNAALIVSSGDLDVEGYATSMFGSQDGDPPSTPTAAYLFAASSSEGVMSLRYSAVSSNNNFILSVRGVDVLTLPSVHFAVGDDLRWRGWYRNSSGVCGIRIWVNGSFQEITAATTGAALVVPTVAYLGSDTSGANGFAALHTKFIAHGSAEVSAPAPEFLLLGDSISTGAYFVHAPTAWLYQRTVARRTNPGCASLGVSGQVIAQQRGIFDASPYKGVPSIKAVFIQVGTNDIGLGAEITVAAYVTAYNALVADVRAAFPTQKIYGLEIAPRRATLTAPQYTMWQGVNAAYTGGATPITGLSAVISSFVGALNDGSDNLAAQYSIDGLHPNEAGREIIGLAMRTQLLADGLVT